MVNEGKVMPSPNPNTTMYATATPKLVLGDIVETRNVPAHIAAMPMSPCSR